MLKITNLQTDFDEIKNLSTIYVVYKDEDEVYSFSKTSKKEIIEDIVKDFLTHKDNEEELLRLIQKYDVSRFAKEITEDYLFLDEDIKIEGASLYFDSQKLDSTASTIIIDQLMTNNKIPRKTLINFLTKLYKNTSSFVRSQFLPWLAFTTKTGNTLFTIAPDGDVLGYKGFTLNSKKEMVSVNSGYAEVNGVPHNGQIRNLPGDTITMPRSMVQDDPSVACSTGLHIGTFEYASGFAGNHMMLVKFNPEDIVSVPTDCDGQKIRVCRYEVIGRIEKPIKGGFLKTNEDLKALTEEVVIEDYAYDYIEHDPDSMDSLAEYLVSTYVDSDEFKIDELEDYFDDNEEILNTSEEFDRLVYIERLRDLYLINDDYVVLLKDVLNSDAIDLINSNNQHKFIEENLYGYYEELEFKNDIDQIYSYVDDDCYDEDFEDQDGWDTSYGDEYDWN